MADISKITLPSGNTYDIKDAVAREAIAGGVTFIIAWDGESTPVVADIPKGVIVTYNNVQYVGTLSAETSDTAPSPHAQAGAFYLVRSATYEPLDVQYTGLSSVTVDRATFAAATNYQTSHTYAFTWSNGWRLDGSAVTLSDYGITTGSTTTGTRSITITSPKYYIDYYDEYVPVGTTGSKTWEKLGDTQIDLSNVVTDVTLNKVTDVVLGEATTFTNSTSAVTFSGGTTDKVLGESTSFALTSGAVTHGTPSKDNVLGEATTFSVTNPTIAVTPDMTYVTAAASGTAVGANTTGTAITSITPTSDTFLKSASATTSKLVTTSITPTNGTETVSKVTKTASKLATTSITPTNGTESVSKVTKTASKLVTTSITPVSGSTNITPVESRSSQTTADGTTTSHLGTVESPQSTYNQYMLGDVSVSNETLIIKGLTMDTQTTYSAGAPRASLAVPTAASAVTVATGSVASDGGGSDIVTAVTISDKTVAKAGSAVTVATGSVASNGGGADVVTGVTISDKTVAKAGSAVTVATGSVDDDGTGSDVVTGVTVGTTASALTGLGTPSTDTFLKSVKVTTQPTITLTKSDTTSTGAIELVEGITSASATGGAVTANTNDIIAAVTAMPTSTVGTAITVGTNDKVTAITGVGTGTAAAQTITVGTNDKVTTLTNGTSLTVTKGNA